MIPHYKGTVPHISTEEMIEVDRLMIEEYGIDLTRMMENAGANLAFLVNKLIFHNKPHLKKVVVVAGTGGNGGGALVAARRLHNWGAEVKVILSSQRKMKKVTQQQFDILLKMGVNVGEKIDPDADVIIDGIIGYSLKGKPEGRAKELIEEINASGIPVISLDAPSGLNLTDGMPEDPTVKANATLTLALPKTCLFKHKASKYVGNIYLADISVPPHLYTKIGVNEDDVGKIFAAGTVVKINKVIVFSK